jgi:segregation and condensation protein B
MADIKKEVEAILFSAGRTVLLNEFQSLLGMRNPGLVKDTIRELIDEYIVRDSPMMIVPEGEGWKLTVKEKFLPTVQKINPHTELSKTILETLAVISWKQPVLQSQVIKIRTNKAYDHIAELENLGFVTREKHGRSFLIKVTQKFLDYFDLPSAKEIKDVFKDFRDLDTAVQKKADDLEKDKEKLQQEAQETKQSAEFVPGTAVETFSDVLPEMHLPKQGTELEVFDLPPEEIKKDEAVVKSAVKVSVNKPEAAPGRKVETAEEKARRIARELLEEDMPKKSAEPFVEERKLHPQLEEFIAGASQPGKKKAEDNPAGRAAKAKPVGKVAAAAKESDEVKEDEDDRRVAEEFPGQFSDDREGK